MPARLTNETAVSRLLELGYEAIEDYPGGSKPWRAKHLNCGEDVTLTWNRAYAGDFPRCSCRLVETAMSHAGAAVRRMAANAPAAVERMRAAGWEPLEPYPGSHEQWRCRCMDCGSEGLPKLHGVDKSKGCRTCSGRHLITEESAREVLLESGWRPLVAFPGARAHWPSICMKCGEEGLPVYETVHARKSGCRKCSARLNGLKRRQKFEPTAVMVMQGMQLQPLEPFPDPISNGCAGACGAETLPAQHTAASHQVAGGARLVGALHRGQLKRRPTQPRLRRGSGRRGTARWFPTPEWKGLGLVCAAAAEKPPSG